MHWFGSPSVPACGTPADRSRDRRCTAAPLLTTTVGGGGGSVVAELVAETGPRAGAPSDSVTVRFSVCWKPSSVACVVTVDTPTGTVNVSLRPWSLVTVRVASSPLLSTSMVQEIRVTSTVGVMLWMWAATSGP